MKLFRQIIAVFLVWRVVLFITAFVAIVIIPEFGNRFPYFDQVLAPTNLPSWVSSFGGFDGVHYLRIAQDGYVAEYSQAFFPFYPLLIKLFAENNIFLTLNPNLDLRIFVDPIYFYSGLILANLFFIAALIMYYKLVKLDYDEKISLKSLVLLVVFPAAFYFGSIYTESLFLLLSVSSIYLLRRNKILLGAAVAALATATKVLGILLLIVFILELYQQKKLTFKSLDFFKNLLAVFIIPSGLLLYSYFLKINFNDPFYFLSAQPAFGAQRVNDTIVLLPQVIFRYLKILTTVPVFTLAYFNAFIELIFTIVPLLILILAYKKIRVSYFVFTLGCLIIPTLTGTLSSMPRYSLMIFLLLPFLAERFGKYLHIILTVMISIQIIFVMLFTRGYWIS